MTPAKANPQPLKNKTKGQFKNETEFLIAEKKRFEAVFSHVNWADLKIKVM